MVDNDSHQSIHLNKPRLSTTSSGDVLVIATEKSDAELLCETLVQAGYEPLCYNGLSQFCYLPSNSKVIGKILAVVLCHKASSPDSRAAGSAVINMPSQLPNQLRCKRLIVVSDCLTEQTIVSLLEDGAHHCFNLRESPRVLQARLEAALRWHGHPPIESLVHGDISFDVQNRRVTRAGRVIELSPKEYELAYYLFSNHDRVVQNGELLASIWSLPAGVDTRRIDTAACRVRKKLRLTAAHGWELKRLRRIGYRLLKIQGGQEAVSESELLEET